MRKLLQIKVAPSVFCSGYVSVEVNELKKSNLKLVDSMQTKISKQDGAFPTNAAEIDRPHGAIVPYL